MADKKILIIGEFPVIHKGYIDFFNKVKKELKQTQLYVGFLGEKIIKEMTEFEPDIRKIPAVKAKKIIFTFLAVKACFVLDKTNFSRKIMNISPHKIIILLGDKSENFAKDYLNKKKYKEVIRYYDVRLKWDSKRVAEFRKKKSPISKGELKTRQKFMKQAFEQAENSNCWWRQVGAVLVKNKKVILSAFNEMMPTDNECYKIGCIRDHIEPGKSPEICSAVHAEAKIIAQAAREKTGINEATLYITHFPCPVCSKLIALSGIKKMVYSRGSSLFDGEKVMKSREVEIIKI